MDLPPPGQVLDRASEAFYDASPLHKYRRKPGENFFEYRGGDTALTFHVVGLGDTMMVYQMGRAFVEYVKTHGDPDLGDVVVTTGGYAPKLTQRRGDHNLYWWYSFGPHDDSPRRFHDEFLAPNLSVRPDTVLCGSKRIRELAEDHGYDTLYFPIAQYGYEPLGFERRGMGYAGSRWHKSGEKVRTMLGPFRERDDFEWVSEFTTPDQMNLWYNTRRVTFGITKEGQRQWGVVNSRVFETLASGTPLVMGEHPTVEDVLGFEYPYQVSTRQDAVDTVAELLENPEETAAEFEEYADRLREEHSYVARLEKLFTHLS